MIWTAVGACSALVAVALGAFGAHGLRSVLAPESLAIFETGVRYQLVHAIALVALGLGAHRLPAASVRGVGAMFGIGSILFAGSLYVLVFTGVRAWGAVTPLGGLAFLAGWGWLAFAAWSVVRQERP
ncbi:MAG: DUF423 domain-containing protein [Candidatus Eisenbacteria bacterium]